MNIVKRFFVDKDGNLAVIQMPNAPIVAWLVFLILSNIWSTGSWHDLLSNLGTVSLLVWAVLEVGWGASYFRRALGLVVLCFVILR